MNIKHIDMHNHPGGLAQLTVIVDADKTALGELVDKVLSSPEKYELEIKRIKTKRGLTANAYYWALVDKLSKALSTSKGELHEEMMRRYGTMKTNDDGKPIVFSLIAGEDPRTITKHSLSFAEGEVNGKRFIHYAVLKGSSEMSVKEFGDLLDGLISECKEASIETLTPREVAELEYLNPNTPGN